MFFLFFVILAAWNIHGVPVHHENRGEESIVQVPQTDLRTGLG